MLEYLKGGGGTEITTEVPLELGYPITDEIEAEAIADHMHDGRDRTYEDREAIVFLIPSPKGDYVWSEGSSGTYRFTGPHRHPMYTHRYAITSDYNRAWLPSSDVGGASRSADPSELTYLTEAPPDNSGGVSEAVSSTPPSISLSEIKEQVLIIYAHVHAGRDVPGYLQCVEDSFRYAARLKARPIEPTLIDREIPSGSARRLQALACSRPL